MTDRELIDHIKQDIIRGNTADFLTLDIVDTETKKRYCYRNLDDIMQILFDYSLAKTIVGMTAIHPFVPGKSKSYSGDPYPIIGYLLAIGDSADHQTNISPMLMKFLEVILKRGVIDRLAYPMGRNRIEYEFRGYNGGTPIIYIPSEDPWDALEGYLREGEEAVSHG